MGKLGEFRTLVGRAFFILIFVLLPSLASACRLALILALDVSSSVDASEHDLQRRGTASALLTSDVQTAFFAHSDPVALAVFEWSGRYNQSDVLDWILIREPSDLFTAANRIRNAERSHNDFPTALGHALGHAALRFQQGPECLQRTIDMSGDGANNDGFGPQIAYGAFPLEGVTVNGLVIRSTGSENAVSLAPYYRQEVLRGPGAFIEIADGFEDYAAALERKLVRELTSFAIGSLSETGVDQG